MVYDINLVPKNKRNEADRIGFYMVLIGILCAVVLLIFFYINPSQKKLSLVAVIQKKEDTLAEYTKIEEEFTTLTASVYKVNHTITVLKKLQESKTETSKWMDDFEQSMPPKVIITSLVSQDEIFAITGTCSTYREIAQFMVNLRAIDGVASVTLANAAKQEETISENTVVSNYEFLINVKYIQIDIISDLQAEEAAALIQEEDENEAD